MGRDSLEASLRLIHGTKPAEEYHELGNKRARMTLDHPDPAHQGSPLTWRAEDGVPVASHIPQVRFLKRDGRGWVSHAGLVSGLPHRSTRPASSSHPHKGWSFGGNNHWGVPVMRRSQVCRCPCYSLLSMLGGWAAAVSAGAL
jgi:hypothetical protein